MWKSVFADVALLSALAGSGLAALPTGALAAPVDGTPRASPSQSSEPLVRAGRDTLVFSTAQHQFDPGVNNQGWWSDIGEYGNDDSNDNYALNGSDGGATRDFFTFDVSALKRRHIVSATLRLNTADVTGLSGAEVLRLSDVSTDPVTLNTNTGSSPSIFRDLGTGAVYGKYPIGTVHSDQQLAIHLNKKAVHALKRAAKRAHGGFFSIGGRLLNFSPAGGEIVFSNSQGRPVELVVRARAKRSA
jgi:hypothetical protein